jgi:hypothetical protein
MPTSKTNRNDCDRSFFLFELKSFQKELKSDKWIP